MYITDIQKQDGGNLLYLSNKYTLSYNRILGYIIFLSNLMKSVVINDFLTNTSIHPKIPTLILPHISKLVEVLAQLMRNSINSQIFPAYSPQDTHFTKYHMSSRVYFLENTLCSHKVSGEDY